ncbi:MAG: tetratricopeptide repeat protein [Proteobacteria bacterium]|nr:tetratricopeptide repeat protein [Pseudomonadota bacterium]
MKTILATILTVLLLLPIPAFGEIKIITHAVKQPFGGSQSPDDARIAAVAKAKREALELAGTYVESTTVVKNAQVEKDEIHALTAGVLKAEVVSQKNYTTGDAFGIEVTVRVEVDTAVLEARLKTVLEDRTHFEQLKQARAWVTELLEKIALLEAENRKSGKSEQKSANLKNEFPAASRGLTAVDWFYKSVALGGDGKFTDPGKAIEYLSEAIRLKPDFMEAYNNRGTAYGKLGQYQRAIQDCDTAIRLNPDDAYAYYNRGIAYGKLRQYQRAIQDYDTAIRLNPDYAMAYNNRGNAYDDLGQYQRAIQDYDTAIRLKPDAAEAYNNRGIAYGKLGQYQRAIQDCDTAIRLNPDYAKGYYNRGIAYGKLGQYQRAIQDFDTAIRLEPDAADAYNNRGAVNSARGIQTLKASRLIEEAWVLLRVLLEAHVNFFYFFRNDPVMMSQRFSDATILDKLKHLREVNFYKGTPMESQFSEKEWQDSEAAIRGRYKDDEFKALKRHGFSGLSFEARCAAINMKILYQMCYRIASRSVHSFDPAQTLFESYYLRRSTEDRRELLRLRREQLERNQNMLLGRMSYTLTKFIEDGSRELEILLIGVGYEKYCDKFYNSPNELPTDDPGSFYVWRV